MTEYFLINETKGNEKKHFKIIFQNKNCTLILLLFLLILVSNLEIDTKRTDKANKGKRQSSQKRHLVLASSEQSLLPVRTWPIKNLRH